MNNNIIKKCLEELQKKDFRKDYVIGMLETLYEMSAPTERLIYTTSNDSIKPIKQNDNIKADEEIIPEFLKTGKLGHITTE